MEESERLRWHKIVQKDLRSEHRNITIFIGGRDAYHAVERYKEQYGLKSIIVLESKPLEDHEIPLLEYDLAENRGWNDVDAAKVKGVTYNRKKGRTPPV